LPRVIVTPRAVADLRELVTTLALPPDAFRRVQRSLRILERFPRAGRPSHLPARRGAGCGHRWQAQGGRL